MAQPSPSASPVHDREVAAALIVRGMTVRFGAVIANDSIDLYAHRGAITGVIGPNGAGKSTLLDAIGGFLPAAGEVSLNGHDISGLRSFQRPRKGLGRTFQSAQLFDDLTVEENLVVSSQAHLHGARARARETLTDLGINDLANLLPSRLSTGQRRLSALARALVHKPTVLLMDEPAAGLSKPERQTLSAVIVRLANSGTAIVLVDHDVDLVLNISAYVYVLSAGCLLTEGNPTSIRASREVREAYLGGAVEEAHHG